MGIDVLASASTGLWVAIGLLVLLKVPLVGALLWLPFRNDDYGVAPADGDGDSAGEDGGGGGGGVLADPDVPRPDRDSPRRGPRHPHGRPVAARRRGRGDHRERPSAPARVRVGVTRRRIRPRPMRQG